MVQSEWRSWCRERERRERKRGKRSERERNKESERDLPGSQKEREREGCSPKSKMRSAPSPTASDRRCVDEGSDCAALEVHVSVCEVESGVVERGSVATGG